MVGAQGPRLPLAEEPLACDTGGGAPGGGGGGALVGLGGGEAFRLGG